MKNNVYEEKEERHFKKRILLLLLLLFVTGIMLATSSYAWFTANETVSISNIKVNVATSNGIQISADGQVWKSILQTADLTGAHSGNYTSAVNMIPDALEPVSTDKTVASGKIKMWYGETKTSGNDFILTTSACTEVDNSVNREDANFATNYPNADKFIAFDIFLKVTNSTAVYLTSSSGITTDDVTDTGIKNASRIAFLTLGNTASGSSLSTIQGLNSGTSVFLWEPNFDAHTAAGASEAQYTYGITTNISTTAANNTAAIPYDGVKAVISEGEAILLTDTKASTHSDKFVAVTPDLTTREAWTGTSTVTYEDFVTLQPGITKMRVYVWVEGQDVDCENTASGGNIIFNLQITTNNNPTA